MVVASWCVLWDQKKKIKIIKNCTACIPPKNEIIVAIILEKTNMYLLCLNIYIIIWNNNIWIQSLVICDSMWLKL